MLPPDMDINKGVELLLKGDPKPKPIPKNLIDLDLGILYQYKTYDIVTKYYHNVKRNS